MTSAIQPIGLIPRTRPRWLPFGRPRPTAAGYSSRSNPARVGMPSSRRSRRSSARGRLSTMTRGQPLATAASAWALMFGYLAALKRSRCTLVGRLQPLGLVPVTGGFERRRPAARRAWTRQALAVHPVAVGVPRIRGALRFSLGAVVRARRRARHARHQRQPGKERDHQQRRFHVGPFPQLASAPAPQASSPKPTPSSTMRADNARDTARGRRCNAGNGSVGDPVPEMTSTGSQPRSWDDERIARELEAWFAARAFERWPTYRTFTGDGRSRLKFLAVKPVRTAAPGFS